MIDPWLKRFELKSKVTHLVRTGYVLKYFRNEVSNCVASLHDSFKVTTVETMKLCANCLCCLNNRCKACGWYQVRQVLNWAYNKKNKKQNKTKWHASPLLAVLWGNHIICQELRTWLNSCYGSWVSLRLNILYIQSSRKDQCEAELTLPPRSP